MLDSSSGADCGHLVFILMIVFNVIAHKIGFYAEIEVVVQVYDQINSCSDRHKRGLVFRWIKSSVLTGAKFGWFFAG